MKPRVSIIIYYKEDRGWLKDALLSVRNQRYAGKVELLIETGGTASENLNRGIKKATGKYIRYLSEDDLLPQYSIHQGVLQFEKDNADFLHANAINFFGYPVIYDDGHISFSGRFERQKPVLKYPTLADLLVKNPIHGGTVMYKTELLKENLFDESLTCAEEYDLNMKLLSKGAVLDYCNADLYLYRRHALQKSLGKGVDQTKRRQIIEQIQNRYK